ncbi:helix-turn-helix domain-containing protein [Bacteroides sp. KG123]|uniref:helix-turn-helix domain-containing protein n=1 Tax=unclassified Bacteroides TaxID=2646097 RepID=UPI003D7F391C
MDFRIRIKEICQSKGITQRELADKMGISDISLNKTLRGEYPQLQSLERIAKSLDVDIVELFGKNTSDSEVNGYVKVKGTLYEVHSFEDLKKLLELNV